MLRTTTSRRLGALATATVALAALVGCSSPAPADETTPDGQSALLSEILDRGRAIIGVYDSPPDSTAVDGVPAGLYPEIDMAILEKLGITEFGAALSDFAGLAPGMQSGSVDMVSGAFFITEPRCDVMVFGNPIAVTTYGFVTAPGAPTFTTFEEIKAAGATLAIENGTHQQAVALNFLTEADMLPVTSRQSGIDAVMTGQADVYVAPARTMAVIREAQGTDYVITETPDIPALGIALAVQPEHADFIEAYNEAWETIFSDGTAEAIMTEYGMDFDQFMEHKDEVFTCA